MDRYQERLKLVNTFRYATFQFKDEETKKIFYEHCDAWENEILAWKDHMWWADRIYLLFIWPFGFLKSQRNLNRAEELLNRTTKKILQISEQNNNGVM